MRNVTNKKIDLKLSDNEYYDFHLAGDELVNECCDNNESPDCFVTWFDFNNPQTFDNSQSIKEIYSLNTWPKSINTGYTFDTVGLTGLDNGQLVYNKLPGDDKNEGLVNILTGSTLTIPSNDYRLK